MEELFEIIENENRLQGPKDGVAVFYHPADRNIALALVQDIFSVYDCTVYLSLCREESRTVEELAAVLSQMSLVVFAVTKRFLSEKSSAKDLALGAAAGLRLLPVQAENGLEEQFSRVVGPYQLINRTREDYLPRLKAFVYCCVSVYNMIGISPEAAAVRNSLFRGKGFISYRKKDLPCLKRMLKEFRGCRELRDVALWYDSSLYPGEDFNEQIRRNLSEADFVLFVVTPSLLEEGNYALEQEYTQAVEEHKPMIAVVMEELPPERLKRACPDLLPLAFADRASWTGAIARALQACGCESKAFTPLKLFFLAEAFAEGVRTERDVPLAFAMYEEAAEAGEPYAMMKLADAYAGGIVLPEDAHRARYWRRRALRVFCERMKSASGTPDEAVGPAFAAFEAADQDLLDITGRFSGILDEETYQAALALVRILKEAAEGLLKAGLITGRANIGIVYLRKGQVLLADGKPEQAQTCLKEAEEYLDRLAAAADSVYIQQSRTELADAGVRAFLWDLCRETSGNGSAFDFPDGILPDGAWGSTVENYRVAAYRCPRCGRRLYKTVFPEGQEPLLYLRQCPGQYVDPARMFICPCGCFYAAPRGEKLNGGLLVRALPAGSPESGSDRELFRRWMRYFGNRGSLSAVRRD